MVIFHSFLYVYQRVSPSARDPNGGNPAGDPRILLLGYACGQPAVCTPSCVRGYGSLDAQRHLTLLKDRLFFLNKNYPLISLWKMVIYMVNIQKAIENCPFSSLVYPAITWWFSINVYWRGIHWIGKKNQGTQDTHMFFWDPVQFPADDPQKNPQNPPKSTDFLQHFLIDSQWELR